MRGRRRGPWWLETFGLFLGSFMLWVLGAWLLLPAGAQPRSLGMTLRSHLHADYGADAVERPLGVLRIEVVGEVLRDLGLPTEQANQQMRTVVVAMGRPVPTATPVVIAAQAPPPATAAPTEPPLPASPTLETATETVTSDVLPLEVGHSPTPVVETPTPSPSATEGVVAAPTQLPTATSTASAAPTATLVPRRDRFDPSVREVTTDPAEGSIEGCVLRVADMRVTDRSPSSGIDLANVLFWYSLGNVRSEDFPAESVTGGWESGSGSKWDAHYAGTLSLAGHGGDRLTVWARARDNSGHRDTRYVGSYWLAGDCP